MIDHISFQYIFLMFIKSSDILLQVDSIWENVKDLRQNKTIYILVGITHRIATSCVSDLLSRQY